MGRRRQFRQPYSLDSGDISDLSHDGICVVLRGAEDLIAAGGRSMLVKILRGSKAKDVKPEFKNNPSYGKWADVPEATVSQRIDWCIEREYLRLEYFGKLPLLLYTDRGLSIECRLIAAEELPRAKSNAESLHAELPDRPLQTQLALLDVIADSEDNSYLPFLEAWKVYATKRISKRIGAIFAEWNGTGWRQRYIFEHGWIDESLSLSAYRFIEAFVKKQGMLIGEIQFISNTHSGMPDVDLYGKLLKGNSACLFTTDRPFHNALCEQKIASFYINDEGRILAAPLKGVKPRGILRNLDKQENTAPAGDVNDCEPEAKPLHPMSVILLPDSPSELKQMRQKRRRIRNYFGGIERIEKCTAALSVVEKKNSLLVGIRLRVLPGKQASGVKALDATELYISETSGDLLGAYIHAGALLVRLHLWECPVTIYHDSLVLSSPEELRDSPAFSFWQELSATFPEFSWGSIGERPRSPHMDKLRQKLRALSSQKKVTRSGPKCNGFYRPLSRAHAASGRSE